MARQTGSLVRVWQRMLSGRRLDLNDPSPLDVEISDIAHGLARVARWNGQTIGRHAFSVAQHSLLVESILRLQWPGASPSQCLAALLHDAPEYVIGDMISPFKSIVGGGYKIVEERVQRAIHLRFGLPAQLDEQTHKAIKHADQVAAYFEATTLAGFSTMEAVRYFGRPSGISPDSLDLSGRSTRFAQAAFLKRFAAIDRRRQELPH